MGGGPKKKPRRQRRTTTKTRRSEGRLIAVDEYNNDIEILSIFSINHSPCVERFTRKEEEGDSNDNNEKREDER